MDKSRRWPVPSAQQRAIHLLLMRAQGVSHLLLMTELGSFAGLGAENELRELARFGFWQRWRPEEGENAFRCEGMRGPLDRVSFEID